MKVLIASDLHSLPKAFHQFVEALKGFDAGIIAGDILDEYIPDQQLIEMLHMSADDFLDELPAPDETANDIVARWRKSAQAGYLKRGLLLKEQEAKAILNAAGKPILIVPGNHDATDWATDRNVINIHMKSFVLQGQRFVGYGCLDSGLEPERQMRQLHKVKRLVDSRTILVTHFPPRATLDYDEREVSFGSRKLARMVARRKPLYHVFGHVHTAAGFSGNSINACYPLASAFWGLDTETGKIWTQEA